VRLDLDLAVTTAALPGSKMIPASHAVRASLAMKLWSIKRKSHVMALLADEGFGLLGNVMTVSAHLSETAGTCRTGLSRLPYASTRAADLRMRRWSVGRQ
jgi:hypothetical protein